jgi:hypothetical protein
LDGDVKALKFQASVMKMLHLKYMLLAQMLLVPCVAFGGRKAASCELANKSIVSRSSSGLAQVTNLAEIEITCSVPGRPFPFLNGLTVITTVHEVSPSGRKKLVPSEVHLLGGARPPGQEEVVFVLDIPLEPAAREAEARRYLAKIENYGPEWRLSEEARPQAMERLQESVYQDRVGRFRVQCRVLDGKRVMGTGTVQLEVLFKGRFSDVWLPGVPPA